MKGFILAAGFGTRLWPLTEHRTKAAIPFLNRPLISYSVEYLVSHGICDILINLHHQPDSIRSVLGDGSALGARITYSLEDEILGTSGALDRMRDQLLDDDFVVINGKIITDIDLAKVLESHRSQGAIETLVLKENRNREHFSMVEVSPQSRITRFAGFPDTIASEAGVRAAGAPGSFVVTNGPAPLMFTGIQVLSPRILDYIPSNCFSHSTVHVYPQAIAAGETVIGHVSSANWYEMSTPRRYLEANLRFKLKEGRSVIEGQGCSIGDGASVENTVMWDRVIVERGASVTNAVIADGVRIPAGAVIDHAVVVCRDNISSPIERGEITGENLIVPL